MSNQIDHMPNRLACKQVLIATILDILAILLFGCEPSKTSYEHKLQEESRQTYQKVQEFSEKWNADAAWAKGFKQHTSYTIELQRGLLGQPQKAHLLVGWIDDIYLSGGQPHIAVDLGGVGALLHLAVTDEQVDYIMRAVPADDGDLDSLLDRKYCTFIIAFHAASVSRPALKLDVEFDGDYPSVISDEPDTLIVKGECIGLESLGRVQFYFHELLSGKFSEPIEQ